MTIERAIHPGVGKGLSKGVGSINSLPAMFNTGNDARINTDYNVPFATDSVVIRLEVAFKLNAANTATDYLLSQDGAAGIAVMIAGAGGQNNLQVRIGTSTAFEIKAGLVLDTSYNLAIEIENDASNNVVNAIAFLNGEFFDIDLSAISTPVSSAGNICIGDFSAVAEAPVDATIAYFRAYTYNNEFPSSWTLEADYDFTKMEAGEANTRVPDASGNNADGILESGPNPRVEEMGDASWDEYDGFAARKNWLPSAGITWWAEGDSNTDLINNVYGVWANYVVPAPDGNTAESGNFLTEIVDDIDTAAAGGSTAIAITTFTNDMRWYIDNDEAGGPDLGDAATVVAHIKEDFLAVLDKCLVNNVQLVTFTQGVDTGWGPDAGERTLVEESTDLLNTWFWINEKILQM